MLQKEFSVLYKRTFSEHLQSTEAGYSLGKFGVEMYPGLLDNVVSLQMSVTAASGEIKILKIVISCTKIGYIHFLHAIHFSTNQQLKKIYKIQ